MTVFKQLRYFGDGEPRNSKNSNNEELTKDILTNSGDLIKFIAGEAANIEIKQLGIQSTPGTKFYINNEKNQTPIMVGQTGIFELDLTSYDLVITALSFDRGSIRDSNNGSNSFLIIDLKYEEATNN